MKFQTHNDDKEIYADGSFQGEVKADYSDLKKLFGTPDDSDGYKVDAEWVLKFEDGTIASIYNWKDGKNYNGSRGTAKTKITNWHIGGQSEKSVTLVEMALKGEAIREKF